MSSAATNIFVNRFNQAILTAQTSRVHFLQRRNPRRMLVQTGLTACLRLE
jgi:hypothetical protein